MDAIVYTSESGFTAQYAALLGEALSLPVYALKETGPLPTGSSVVYLGWMMAGMVKGLKKAQRRFSVKAVCAVGMGAPGSQTPESIAQQNHLAPTLAVFYLEGGFALERLHGVYRFMMQCMAKTVGQKLSQKEELTPDEAAMLERLQHGFSCVCKENLAPVLEWISKSSQSAAF